MDTASYTAVTERLFSLWDEALRVGAFTVISEDSFDPVKSTRVLALAHHVRRLCEAALDVIDTRGALIAIPTIRSGFECALTAMWIAQSKDAAQAWMAQDPATRRAFQLSLRAADSEQLRRAADKVVGTDPLGVESTSDTQADKIVEMLADFEGGRDLYVRYRFLCSFTHASPMLTDSYLRLDTSPTSNGYEFEPTPEEPDRTALVLFVAASMLWALSAVRFIHKDRTTLRPHLQKASRQLGVPGDYQLTAQALARQDGRTWGRATKPTPKSLRIAAKAKGLQYATSPGTGSDNPAHYVWPVGTSPAAITVFETIDDAAAHILSQ